MDTIRLQLKHLENSIIIYVTNPLIKNRDTRCRLG